jgi:bacterioferritin-associated ferredoxin
MANLSIYIKFIRKIEEVDPDGSQCEQCGDTCYLQQFKAGVWIENKNDPIEVWSATCCGSCEEWIREAMEQSK